MIFGVVNIKNLTTGEEGFHSNLILDSGLVSIYSGTWSNDVFSIGSNSLDVDPSQTSILTPYIINQGGFLKTFEDGPFGQESYAVKISKEFKRNECNGLWWEVGINGFNRSMFRRYGILPSGQVSYAVSAYNSTGEGPVSSEVFIDLLNSGTTSRIKWDKPTDTSINPKKPDGYNIYKNISGTLIKIAQSPEDRKYFYDSGFDYSYLTNPIENSASLDAITNLSGTEFIKGEPYPFLKKNNQEVLVEVKIFFSNFEYDY